jgi:multiple sugar transport system substrate-binding protein
MTGINTRAIPLFEKVVQAWNEAHPDGPKIENMARPGINILQQYETMTAGATAPDLVALDPTQAVIFSAKGTLLPLDSYIQQDKYDLSDFFKISLSEYVWKGQLYALPRGYSNQLVFVNLKMFQEDQLPLPPADFNAPGWTFDDLLETATKLTKRDSSGRISQYGFMVQTGGLRGGYGFWIWSAGGEFFDKDETAA